MEKANLYNSLTIALKNVNDNEKNIENCVKELLVNNIEWEEIQEFFKAENKIELYKKLQNKISESIWFIYIKQIKFKKEDIVLTIFENIIIKNDYKFLKKDVDDSLFKKITEKLIEITYYSISNNYSENYFGEMIGEEIGVSEEFIIKLKELYIKEFINLKLTYLILVNNNDNN